MTQGTVPHAPRCGDHVLHRPTGETWVVAWADPRTDDVAWAGWPNGVARLSGCEVSRRCSDQEHERAVMEWRCSMGSDGRRERVLSMYGSEVA